MTQHQSALAYPAHPAIGQGMTRTQQTAWIVGAIVVVGLFLALVLWPAPSLDGMDEMQKCTYSSYYEGHGGSVDACREQVVDAARARLMGGTAEVDANLITSDMEPANLF